MKNNAVITVVLCLVVFLVGFGAGRLTAQEGAMSLEVLGNDIISEETNTPSPAANTAVEGATTINTSSLTPGQRQMIEALGIDADSITITPEMIACAEAKLGAARIEEIKNGASPTFTEGASLVACYR